MKKLILLGIVLLSVSKISIGQDSAAKATVSNIGFDFKEGKSDFTISFDHEVTVEKSESDNQVILEIKNATIPAKWARKLDTSQYKSNIALISPYQAGDDVRVVLQLKQAGSVDVNPSGSEIIAQIDNMDSSLSSSTSADTPSPPVIPEESKSISATGSDTGNKETFESTGDPNDSLNQFFSSQQNKRYIGKRISLQLRDAPLADVFRVVSEASEFNIVLGDDVKGKVMLNLTDVPWDQALDLILHSFKLGAERVGNVLRVVGLDALTKEKEALAAAKQASEAAEPLVVKIFPISYAKVDDLKKVLSDFLSREANQTVVVTGVNGQPTQQQSSSGGSRGTIQVDTRTNSLIVRETPTTIEKFKRIIKELDTQTPQVLIEAKFVQVTEGNTKSIEGRLFASSRELDSTGSLAFTASKTKDNFGSVFGGTTVKDQLLNLPTGGFALSNVAGGGASFGISPHAKLLPGINEIGALLSILESENHAKIISSPRVIAQNKEEASISQGNVLQIQNQAGLGGTGGFTAVNAALKLIVTPQVTNEGSITLKITFSEDTVTDIEKGSTSTKRVETLVNVDSGSTLVIGGIYTNQLTESESGIPFLRDLPILGVLFGSRSKTLVKSELFIFLNPRILNEKESGIKG